MHKQKLIIKSTNTCPNDIIVSRTVGLPINFVENSVMHAYLCPFSWGRLNVVEYLLKNTKSDVHLKTIAGETPLDLARR